MEDVDAYLEESVNTKFADLKIAWDSSCSQCLLRPEFGTFEEFLEHITCVHNDDIDEYPCVIQQCTYVAPNKESLARHVVRKHVANLESRCAFCGQSCKTFNDLNRHSCCRSLKWQPGKINYCVECKLEFRSFKRYIFHMQFHSDEVRPNVCLICDSQFPDTEALFEHVQYDHQPIEELSCKKCDRNFSDKLLYESHLRSHDKPFKYECMLCQKRYNYKSLLSSHHEIYHSAERIKWTCEVCHKVYLKEATLLEHMRVHSFETNITIHYCSQCGLIGHEEEEVMRHMEEVDASPCCLSEIKQDIINSSYCCEYCSADFMTVSDLQNHRNSNVHSDSMYKCNICDCQFDEFKKLRLHIITHPMYRTMSKSFPLPRLYMCDYKDCTNAYPVWTSLYRHKRMHKAKRNSDIELRCQFCYRQFDKKMALSVHIARAHNNAIKTCAKCNRSFCTESDLNEHTAKVHESVNCQFCNKTVKSRRYLARHISIVHVGEQRFFCKHCDKGYYYESELNNHIANVHSSVVYACTTCQFRTKYFTSLKTHLSGHSSESRHFCPACDTWFRRKESLAKHMRAHKQQFLCSDRVPNGCSAMFDTDSSVQQHIENNHTEQPKQKRAKTDDSHELSDDEDGGREFMKGLDYVELYDETLVLEGSPNDAEATQQDPANNTEGLLYENDFEVLGYSTNPANHTDSNNVEHLYPYEIV